MDNIRIILLMVIILCDEVNMKKPLVVLFCIVFIFTAIQISGCGIREEDKHDAIGYFKALNSYSVHTDIEVKNDKQTTNYSARQIYSIGLGYRLELNKDIVMLYKDDKIYVADLKNKQKYITDKKFDDVYRLSFLGEFIGLLYTNENIDCSYITKDYEEYELIKTSIPANNRNISYGVLMVSVKQKIPMKLTIYDSNNNERIAVSYKNFKAGADVDKSLFNTD